MTIATERAARRGALEQAPPEVHGVLRLIEGGASAIDGAGADTAGEPQFREFLEALGVAVYTTDAAGKITYYNQAATRLWGREPEKGEEWCGSWRLFWPNGNAMKHDECPMAIALREQRPVRGYEAMAERPDGTRVSFTPYPTPLRDESGKMIGAVNVLIDVTERRRAEDALRATAEALAASNAVKDEFLGLVSHELRTPVTTIFGNARLLLDRGERLAPADRESMIGDISHDSSRLLGVIENLLMLTRLESGSQLDLEPQILGRAVGQAVDGYRVRHTDRRVVLDSTEPPIIVEADATNLELVMENLLTNAGKYSASGTSIEVVVRTRGEHGEVVVRDRGIGIDAAEIDMLFVPFYRAEAVRTHGNGVGIGLAVCKRVIESQGGRIWARARKGGGAEFGFSLPLAADPDSAA